MTASWIVALSFFTVSTVLLTSGINALQSNSRHRRIEYSLL